MELTEDQKVQLLFRPKSLRETHAALELVQVQLLEADHNGPESHLALATAIQNILIVTVGLADNVRRSPQGVIDGNRWIKTSEQMPDVHAEVLGYDAFYAVIDRAVWSDAWSDAEDEPRLVFLRTGDCEITHWMPMPAPPEDASHSVPGR